MGGVCTVFVHSVGQVAGERDVVSMHTVIARLLGDAQQISQFVRTLTRGS